MKRSQLIALIAGGVCVIAALAVILGMMLLRGGVFSQAGRGLPGGDYGQRHGCVRPGRPVRRRRPGGTDRDLFLYPEAGGRTATLPQGRSWGCAITRTPTCSPCWTPRRRTAPSWAFDLEKMYTFDLTGFLDQVEQDYNDQLAQAQAQAEAQTLAAQDTAQQEGAPAEGREGEDAPAEGDSAEAGDAARRGERPGGDPGGPQRPPKRLLTV